MNYSSSIIIQGSIANFFFHQCLRKDMERDYIQNIVLLNKTNLAGGLIGSRFGGTACCESEELKQLKEIKDILKESSNDTNLNLPPLTEVMGTCFVVHTLATITSQMRKKELYELENIIYALKEFSNKLATDPEGIFAELSKDRDNIIGAFSDAAIQKKRVEDSTKKTAYLPFFDDVFKEKLSPADAPEHTEYAPYNGPYY